MVAALLRAGARVDLADKVAGACEQARVVPCIASTSSERRAQRGACGISRLIAPSAQEGSGPLSWAAAKGQTSIVVMLLEAKAGVNMADEVELLVP